MFNVAVINLKNLIKNIVKIIIAIIIVAMIINLCKEKSFSFNYKFNIAYLNIISSNLAISSIYEEENEELGLYKILSEELAVFESRAKEEQVQTATSNNIEDVVEEKKEAIVENVEMAEITLVEQSSKEEIKSLPTQIIETNNKKDVFTNTYGSVKIKNESKYTLTQEMLTPTVDFNNKQDILIFHTHTCESYTPTANKNYVSSGNFRTIDLNFSVAHVGDVLTKYLTDKGYKVTHDKTKHDYPAYSGSYNRSYSTVKNLLSGDAWTEFVIDLHRDALGDSGTYGPTVKIGDEVAAQLMFVMGTDGGGLNHPNWLNNFKLAIKIQEKANELYPGLFKPIILRNSRYNQNLASGACIIEVGATGNTLEQCEVSMKYLANVIGEVMK